MADKAPPGPTPPTESSDSSQPNTTTSAATPASSPSSGAASSTATSQKPTVKSEVGATGGPKVTARPDLSKPNSDEKKQSDPNQDPLRYERPGYDFSDIEKAVKQAIENLFTFFYNKKNFFSKYKQPPKELEVEIKKSESSASPLQVDVHGSTGQQLQEQAAQGDGISSPTSSVASKGPVHLGREGASQETVMDDATRGTQFNKAAATLSPSPPPPSPSPPPSKVGPPK